MELQSVWPIWIGGHVNRWIATLGISHGRRNMGPDKTDWWWGDDILSDYILRNLWMGMRIPGCRYIITFAPLACVALWNDEKNRSTPNHWPCLECNPLLQQKTPLCPATAQNAKDIFQSGCQHVRSNLCSPLQLALLLKLPNANITKKVFSAPLETLLNTSKHQVYKWNQIRTRQFDGVARSQETARQKLCPSFKTPDNAMKQGKNLWALFHY